MAPSEVVVDVRVRVYGRFQQLVQLAVGVKAVVTIKDVLEWSDRIGQVSLTQSVLVLPGVVERDQPVVGVQTHPVPQPV